jgi:hypothetical protein
VKKNYNQQVNFNLFILFSLYEQMKIFSTEYTFSHPFARVTSAFWRKYPNEDSAHVKAVDCYDRKMMYVPYTESENVTESLQEMANEHKSIDEQLCQDKAFADHPTAVPITLNKIASILRDNSSEKSASSSTTSTPVASSVSSQKFSPVLISNRIISCESAIPTWIKSLGVSSHAYMIETTVVCPHTKILVAKSRNITGHSLITSDETCIYRESPQNPNHTLYTQEIKFSAFLPMFSSKFENLTLANVSSKSRTGLQTIEKLCEHIQRHGVLSLFDMQLQR